MTHQDAIQTMAVERYLLDEMGDEERERFEAHYFGCTRCAEDLRVADLIREETAAASVPVMRPPATVLRPNRPSWRRPLVALPWAAAASLAVLVGYQSLVRIPALEELGEPRVLSPVVLRPPTRGADVIVPIADGQKLVSLAPDVTIDPRISQLSFDLLGPDGNTLVSGRASAPPAGVPLMFLVPTDKLARAGRHVLILRDSNQPPTVLGEYAFVTSP